MPPREPFFRVARYAASKVDLASLLAQHADFAATDFRDKRDNYSRQHLLRLASVKSLLF